MTPPRITTDIDTSGVGILAVAGRLCADTADGLTAAVAAAVREHGLTRLVVDLARVDDTDEASINILLDARATALQAGLTFRVMRPQPSVRRALHSSTTCQLLTWAG